MSFFKNIKKKKELESLDVEINCQNHLINLDCFENK